MGQYQRMVLGVIVTLFAYKFMQDGSQRNYFHRLVAEELKCLGQSYCYCCAESLRIFVSAIMISGGLSLLFDASLCLGASAQIIFLCLQALKLRCCNCLGIYQNIFIHILILTVIANNFKERKAERKAEKEKQKQRQRLQKEAENKKQQKRFEAQNPKRKK